MSESIVERRRVAIGDLCTRTTSGGTPSRSRPEFYVSEGIPWVKTQELTDRTLFDAEEHISSDALRESSAKLLPPDTVLVAMYGATAGQLGFLRKEMACNQACCALIANPEYCDARFLYYALWNDRPRLKSFANGAAQQNLSVGTISRLEVDVPSLVEQRAIAEVLGALDDKIEVNRRTTDRALAFAVQCMRSASREIALAELASIIRKTLSPDSFAYEEVDHFSLPAFDNGQVPMRELGSNIKSGKQEVTNNLVLVSKLNPHIPRIWYAIAMPSVRAVASTEFVCLQALGDTTAEELWACCSTSEFTSQLQELVTGTTGSHQRVRPEDMMKIPVANPTTLTAAMRSAIRSTVSLGEALRRETPTLAALRDTLLPRLMSGELCVRDAKHLVEELV